MDLFDDSEDDNDDNDATISIEFAVDLSNIAFIAIMRLKPYVKRSGGDKPTIMHRSVLMISCDDHEAGSATLLLRDKLQRAQYKDVIIITDLGKIDQQSQFDIVINLNSNFKDHKCSEYVISGGTYITIDKRNSHNFPMTLASEVWNNQKVIRKILIDNDDDLNKEVEFLAIQKRAVIVNTLGAIYWTGKKNHKKIGHTSVRDKKNSNGIDDSSGSFLDKEYMNLDEVTVSLSHSERRLGIFSDASHSKAIHALNEYGLCILPGLFPSETVMNWGTAAVKDMSAAINAMKKKNIDIFRTGDEGPRIENFHELSMREALRYAMDISTFMYFTSSTVGVCKYI